LSTTRRFVSVLAAALAAAAPAAAIDLTGTWYPDGDVLRCKIRSGANAGFLEKDGNLSPIRVRQVADELWIEINPGSKGYENKFLGVAFAHPQSDTKGYAVVSACTVPEKFYAGTMLISKARTDGELGSFVLEYTGTRLGTIATCKGRYTRASAADPGITLTCP
jgi:hypothetical protein